MAFTAQPLAVGCAGSDATRDYDGPVALRIEENWQVVVEQPSRGFLDTVGRNAGELADTAGKGSAVVGCVAGGLTLAMMVRGQGAEAACMLGGFGLYPVGFALGYGTGALVGTIQGTINLFAGPADTIDTSALRAVIESATPERDLENSVFARSRYLSPVSLVRGGESAATGDNASPATPGPAWQLTLTIYRLELTKTTAKPPTSRLRLSVRAELRNARTGQAIKGGRWRYKSERLSTADLANDAGAALRSELAEGWWAVAGEIILDLFDGDRARPFDSIVQRKGDEPAPWRARPN